MRKSLIRLLVAAIVVSGLLSAGAVPSAGEHLPVDLVDLAVIQNDSQPVIVSPAGDLVLYRVTVTNEGSVATSGARLEVDLPDTFSYADGYSTSGDDAATTGIERDCGIASAAAEVVACGIGSIPPQGSASFDVVAATDPTVASPTTYTTTATVSQITAVVDGVTVSEPIENSGNNSRSALTTVRPTNGDSASGFVPRGDSLSLTVADGRRFTLTVPADSDSEGVIVRELRRSETDGVVHTCELKVCGKGFAIDFVDHPRYNSYSTTNPLRAEVRFGALEPCRGGGLGSNCIEAIYTARNSLDVALRRAPYCVGAGGGVATPAGTGEIPQQEDGYYYPCVNDEYKQGSSFGYSLRLRSVDPPTLPGLDL